jgi:2-oxoglutarate dehydrogenase E2 component (dihydrolipoamide succinyltransferase)
MLVDVKVPQLSESVPEATLLAWHKKSGEYVERDQNLIDIETDKVVLEVPAPASGVLVQVAKNDGGTVVSNEVIAQIDTDAKAAAKAQPPSTPGSMDKEAPAPARAAASATAPSADAPTAMPAAKKLAEEHGVDLAQVSGSGRGGRVTKADVLASVQAGASVQKPAEANIPAAPATAAPSPIPASARAQPAGVDPAAILGNRPQQRVPMSRLRARIAERLVQSQATAAILTTFNEVNMQPVMDLRSRYRDRFEKEHGVRLGFMSFFVKAAVAALKRYPVLNASIDGNDVVYHGYFDIGIAVASPRGLVVPIIRNADQLSVAEIEKTIADFGKRAQDGKLGIEELSGGTFSISNGGVFGSMLSTPIINPPQSAILGVHATKDRPVVEDGQVVVRPMNYLALSYDHRIIDGREAVLGLVAMKEALEDPVRMVLDV